MRIILLLGIIDVFLIGFSAPQAQDAAQKDFIAQLNTFRQDIAYGSKRGNMHELVYSEDLAELLSDKKKGTERLWSSVRYTRIEKYENGMDTVMANYKNYNQQKKEEKQNISIKFAREPSLLEFLLPLQTSIACTKRPNKSIDCLLGPEGSLESWDSPPGSGCLQGYKNIEWLCELDTAMVDQLTFIAKLNEYRQFAANLYSFSSMYELAYDENLAKTAEGLTFNGDVPGARIDWRYTIFKNFKDGLEELKIANELHSSKTEKERREEWHQGWNWYLKSWEHIFPEQRFVGCAIKNPDQVLCLFGPRGNDPVIKRSYGPPGSNCTDGYLNNNGLCSLPGSWQNPTELPSTAPPSDPETSPAPQDAEDASTTLDPLEVIISSNQDSVGHEDTKTQEEPSTEPAAQDVAVDSEAIDSVTTVIQSISSQTCEESTVPMSTETPEHTGPTTTTEMSEVAKLVAAYKKEETDGDEYDEDDRTTTEESSSFSIPIFLNLVFVVFWI